MNALKQLTKLVETLLFNIRWVLILFYLGLTLILFVYGYAFFKDIAELFSDIKNVTTKSMLLTVLDFGDIVMIANLIEMIITGSYNSFVSKDHGYKNKNISSGMLKIKM